MCWEQSEIRRSQVTPLPSGRWVGRAAEGATKLHLNLELRLPEVSFCATNTALVSSVRNLRNSIKTPIKTRPELDLSNSVALILE